MSLISTCYSTACRPLTCKGVVADRFLAGAMGDALAARRYPPVEWRVGQWSTATEDLASFRRYVLDGPLAVAHECRRAGDPWDG